MPGFGYSLTRSSGIVWSMSGTDRGNGVDIDYIEGLELSRSQGALGLIPYFVRYVRKKTNSS